MRGRWIHFPLKPQDLALHLPWTFGAGVARDALRKVVHRNNGNGNGEETFTSVLEHGLGPTICRDFYFPYARKIWGLPPEDLSSTQAHRRVSAGSLSKMVGKAISFMSRSQAPRKGRFFYPLGGYGQISRAMARAATDAGADIQLSSTVRSISLGTPHRIEVESDGELKTLAADYVWSTIPLSILARITRPEAPPEVLAASRRIEFRAMVLIYLMLEQSQWTEFDAHYFPEADIKLTRLSEPKNYSGRKDPVNRTVLCGELPCTVDDEIWRASDEELTALVRHSLARCGLSIEAPITRVVTRRLTHAYPIYRQGYEQYFNLLDGWANSLERVLTFGRQGLFAHDNTHHALAMAYGAVDCLAESGEFNDSRWCKYRTEFAKHVVED